MDALPDGVLESIFMRLESPVFLVRAAVTCKGWCRVIADAAFLRRFRCLHGPTIAGAYNIPPGAGGHLPCSIDELPKALSFSPSPASGVGGGRSFSLDFLPRFCTAGLGLGSRSTLKILESYGSLLLLHLFDPSCNLWERPSYLVVCEPTTRQFQKLPVSIIRYLNLDGAHLLNGDGSGVISMSNFRVLFYIRSRGRELRANYSIFSSTTNKCSHVETPMGPGLSRCDSIGHTRDAVYWHPGGSTVLALDRSTAEWSTSSLPLTQGRIDELNRSYIGLVAATAGRDGDARVVVSVPRIPGGYLEVFANRRGEWVLDKRIEIDVGSKNRYADSGYPLWVKKYSGFPSLVLVSLCVPQPGQWTFDRFVVDLETTKIKEEENNSDDGRYVYPCPCDLPWPPALCSGGCVSSRLLALHDAIGSSPSSCATTWLHLPSGSGSHETKRPRL